jgi:hypothetical protein
MANNIRLEPVPFSDFCGTATLADDTAIFASGQTRVFETKRNGTEKAEKILKRNETERKENVKVMKRNGTKRNSCETETKRNEISVKRQKRNEKKIE